MAEAKKMTRAAIKKNALARAQKVSDSARDRYTLIDILDKVNREDESDPSIINKMHDMIFGEDLEAAFDVVNDNAKAFDVLLAEILSDGDLGKD